MGHHLGFKGRRRSHATSRFVERRAGIWDVFADGAIGPVVDMRSPQVPGDTSPVVNVSAAARLVWARTGHHDDPGTEAGGR